MEPYFCRVFSSTQYVVLRVFFAFSPLRHRSSSVLCLAKFFFKVSKELESQFGSFPGSCTSVLTKLHAKSCQACLVPFESEFSITAFVVVPDPSEGDIGVLGDTQTANCSTVVQCDQYNGVWQDFSVVWFISDV